MKILAIRGDESRGTDVKTILERLGGYNAAGLRFTEKRYLYYFTDTEDEFFKNLIQFDDISDVIVDDFVIFTIDEFKEKFIFNVGDLVRLGEYGETYTITKMKWDFTLGEVVYEVNGDWYRHYDLVIPCEKKRSEIPNTRPKKEGEEKSLLAALIEHFRTTPKDELEREWNEHNELDEIGPTVEEYIAFVESIKKQSKYPKTYEECCKIVGANPYIRLMYDLSDGQNYPYDIENLQHYENIRRLLICRTAYWKIAGEQMRLGKTWKSDWNDCKDKFCITIFKNKPIFDESQYINRVLAFPTEEIRDIFYENFKDLIENCKELL